MGKRFAETVSTYFRAAGRGAQEDAARATGVDPSAISGGWKESGAIGNDTLLRLLAHLKEPWRSRVRDAYYQDSMPPEAWAELVSLRRGGVDRPAHVTEALARVERALLAARSGEWIDEAIEHVERAAARRPLSTRANGSDSA